MAAGARTGRPSKYSEPLGRKIADALSRGVSPEGGAALAGVARSTLYLWLRTGARDRQAGRETPLAAFNAACEKALAEVEQALVADVVKGGKADWRAAAFLLERRFRRAYGRDALDTETAAEEAEIARLVGEMAATHGIDAQELRAEFDRLYSAAHARAREQVRKVSGNPPPHLPYA